MWLVAAAVLQGAWGMDAAIAWRVMVFPAEGRLALNYLSTALWLVPRFWQWQLPGLFLDGN